VILSQVERCIIVLKARSPDFHIDKWDGFGRHLSHVFPSQLPTNWQSVDLYSVAGELAKPFPASAGGLENYLLCVTGWQRAIATTMMMLAKLNVGLAKVVAVAKHK
jgi:hypothetical protein